MRTLDRYIIRGILIPFGIALVVLTFVLIVPFIIDLSEQLIAKGVAWPIVLRLMVTLLPATLGLTIPMALLVGVLVAFGRLSSDREIVVMMACGISPYRHAAPGRAPGNPGGGREPVGDDRSHSRRQPDPPRNHAADCDRPRRRPGARPRILHRLPRHRSLRPRDPADRRLAGRAGGGHQEPSAAHHLYAHGAAAWW